MGFYHRDGTFKFFSKKYYIVVLSQPELIGDKGVTKGPDLLI